MRFALTPTLSPEERVDIIARVVGWMGVSNGAPVGSAGVPSERESTRFPIETAVASPNWPRSFLPLPGGEGWGEGESRRPLSFACYCDVCEAYAELPKGIRVRSPAGSFEDRQVQRVHEGQLGEVLDQTKTTFLEIAGHFGEWRRMLL